MEKVLVAFSGGLDTSFCVKYLVEQGYEVLTAIADTGGFTGDDLAAIEKRAYSLGAKQHYSLDIRQEYYEKALRYMIFGNVLRGGTYPISVSSERTFQAIAIIECAKKVGAACVAHGSTGAGNDQVRFDLTFEVLAPNIKILTPTRDLALTRQQEIDYLNAHGCNADFQQNKYSINKGLWGTSIGGCETLHSEQALPEEAYPVQVTKSGTERISIDFEAGEIVGFNEKKYSDKIKLITDIENLGAAYGVGRDMHVGDTIIGIKGRVAFAAAAPILVIAAHKLLEKHTLTKWQQHWKEQLGSWYGMFMHEAQYLEPCMRNIEDFLCSTQQNVSGRVWIDLRPYAFSLVGVDSPVDLMKSGLGDYGETNTGWTAADVKGFTKIMAIPMKIVHAAQTRK